jgi:muramoyltetrapeptide carboxypeptidase
MMTASPLNKPQALQSGDTVGLISSGFRMMQDIDIEYATERLQALGLKVKKGAAILDQHGYFAGDDAARAADIQMMFNDKTVKAIFQLRGGFGSARVLDLLNYEEIAKNPKIVMGLSDTTALLLALNHKANLVTFHGPNAGRPWPAFSQTYIKDLLFANQTLTFENPVMTQDDVITTVDRIETIQEGHAQGRLLGGNLAVLTSLIGSDYLPNFDQAILFLEEINEAPYKIDRMLTQLKMAGLLQRLNGIIIGKCINCTPNLSGSVYGSFRLMQVLHDHIKPLKIPSWYGAMISHEDRNFTLPIGIEVEIDAQLGRIKMLERACS